MDRADPRWLVATATLAALAAAAAVTVVMGNGITQARASVSYIQTSAEPPMSYLGAALEADTAGEALLQRSVAVVGPQRGSLMAASINAAESAAKAWTSYKSVAVQLPGEARLAQQYERDYAAGKQIAADALVPIIRSNHPMVLPGAQVLAAERDRQDLTALTTLYERADAAALRSLDRRLTSAGRWLKAGAGIAGGAILLLCLLGFRWAQRFLITRRRRAAAADLAIFETRVMRALEFAVDDDAAFQVAAHAVQDGHPDLTVAVVSCDPTRSRLDPAYGVTACQVTAPQRCPALTAGSPLSFPDSTALDACPLLDSTVGSGCAATCIPLSIAGHDDAVLQLTDRINRTPQIDPAVALIVRHSGERITMLRAFDLVNAQATRDPLTGLNNRRSFERAVRQLADSKTRYTVAFADLDHFKLLNDVHGHAAGDQALRDFSQVLRDCVRPGDLTARWGGEEFVIVLPDCDAAGATLVLERIRQKLAADTRIGDQPATTVSFGVAETRPEEPFAETLARADEALLNAKTTGRNRITVWDERSHAQPDDAALSEPAGLTSSRSGPGQLTDPLSPRL